MHNFVKRALLLPALLAISTSLFARCDVQEVIEMAEEDMSTRMIKDACGDEVDVPECSLSKVIRLVRRGADENEIYQSCDDTPQWQGEKPVEERNAGLPSGAVIQQCGCWGYINIGAVDVAPACASGYAMAVACSAYCPAGGVQWGVRCQ